MKVNLLLALLLLMGGISVQGQEITFKKHGVIVKKMNLKDLLTKTATKNITVSDANEQRSIEYKALDAKSLFDAIYGNDWALAEEILFTCADGYQPSLPQDLFKHHQGFFAYSRVGASDFSISNKNESGKKVEVGPLYLVWSDLAEAASWPYQLTTIDLVGFADRFPKASPPKNSTADVKRGFAVFRKNCIICHTVNGEGGAVAPELNFPVSVTEYYKEPWLRKWISEPSKIRFGTKMPGLSKDTADREKTIDEIIKYLKVMVKNKANPK